MVSSPIHRPVGRKGIISEQTLVLGFIFLGLPFFDMVNGFLVVRGFLPEGGLGSPSQLGRLIATFMLLYFSRQSTFSPVWVAFFFALFIQETTAAFRSNSAVGALFGYVTVIRFLYLYLLFDTLQRYLIEDSSLIGKYLKLNVNFISASIIIANVTGLGNSTYGWGTGTKGFFASGNGLGIYLGVATLLLLAMRQYGVYKNISTTSFVLAIAATLMIGSKTSLALAVVVLFVMIWQSRFRILLFPTVIGLLWYFLDDIVQMLTVMFDIIIIRYKNSPSLYAYIFSGRDTYVQGAFDVINDQDVGVARWLFGGGAYLSYQNPIWAVSFDTLETDLFDILFMYGFVGVLGYIFCLAYGIGVHIRHPYFLLAITSLSLHSLFAGHVVFNAMSSTALIVILALGVVERKRKRAQNRVRSMGNMEVSKI